MQPHRLRSSFWVAVTLIVGLVLFLGEAGRVEHHGVSPSDNSIRVTNIANGETLRYPLALLTGTANGDTIEAVNRNNPGTGKANAVPIQSGRFKITIELVEGENRLRLAAGHNRAEINVFYKPMTTPYCVNIVYVVSNSSTSPETTSERKAREAVYRKIAIAAQLMQTFTAECMSNQGLGRKTFRLKLDKDNNVIINTLTFPSLATLLRQNGADNLFYILDSRINQIFPDNFNRNLVVLSLAGGDINLGARGMALVDSTNLPSWPDSIQQIQNAATDSWYAWGLGTIGGVLHELGHSFGCDHSTSPSSIMAEGKPPWLTVGWYDFNRAFTVTAPYRTKTMSKPWRSGDIPCWDNYDTAQFYFNRWFQPDAHMAQTDKPPVLRINERTNTVIINSANGIGAVQVYGTRVNADYRYPPPQKRVFRFFRTKQPTELRYLRSQLRDLVAAPNGADIIVTDSQGNVVHWNEGGVPTQSFVEHVHASMGALPQW